MFDQELDAATQRITELLLKLNLPEPDTIEWNPVPFQGQWGYGTAASFQVAAAEAKAGKRADVPLRAQEIAAALQAEMGSLAGFVRTEATAGYLNLFVETATYAQRVLDQVLDQGAAYGRGSPKAERVMVEYSQPNTHKAMHVGHLRNVVLGGAMANILEFDGFETVRANYIGDIGWHVIQWLWAYLKFHNGEEPKGDRTRWMQDIYSQATRLVEEDEANEKEARLLFAQWEEKDPELLALWEKTRQWSLDGFNLRRIL